MEAERDTLIHLVGIPHLTMPARGLFPVKGYIVVAMLLLAGGGRMSRQAIAGLLWDDAPEEKALTNLRQLLVRIHKMWPHQEALIETNGPHLSLGPAAERSDLAAILKYEKSTVLDERVRGVLLARGELLDTIDIGGGELAQWFRAERERFRSRVLTLASDVLVEMTRLGRAQEREIDSIGERMLSLEPEREESYRALIEAYGRNGNFEAVNRTYTALTEVLRREFDADPRPGTIAAVRRILASAPRTKIQVVVDRELEQPPQFETDILAIRNLAGLPRVALFPPEPLPGRPLHPLHRTLIKDVANDLSRHRTFAVLATHSSFRVAEDPNSERLAALRSGYMVSGFMIPGGEQMALRLTRQPEGEIIWAAEYQVSLDKLALSFRLITRQIASTLASEIERDLLGQSRTDPKSIAYRHYLQGQARLRNFDLSRLRRARAEFLQATEEDNNFAPSHARIAQTLQLEWLMLGGTDPFLLNQAKAEAATAIKLDSGNGTGHWMAAVVALYQRDFEYTAEKFTEAETLNPHSADLLVYHADALSHLGDAEAGWTRFQRALELNPFPPDYYWWAGATIAIRRRRFAEAIEMCGKMESDESVLRVLAICHAHLGETDVARHYGRRLMENYPGLSAIDMARMAPDRNMDDIDLCAAGFRMAGLS